MFINKYCALFFLFLRLLLVVSIGRPTDRQTDHHWEWHLFYPFLLEWTFWVNNFSCFPRPIVTLEFYINRNYIRFSYIWSTKSYGIFVLFESCETLSSSYDSAHSIFTTFFFVLLQIISTISSLLSNRKPWTWRSISRNNEIGLAFNMSKLSTDFFLNKYNLLLLLLKI